MATKKTITSKAKDARIKTNKKLGRPTISQIAEACGVSKSTVSRVLNNKCGEFPITQKTIDLVKRNATELGYRPNRLARALADNRTYLVGLFVPSLPHPNERDGAINYNAVSPLSLEIFEGILGHSLFQSFDLVLHISPGEQPTKSLQRMPSEDILEGIIVINPAGAQRTHIENLARRIPLVMVGQFTEASDTIYCLDADNLKGTERIIKETVRPGIRRSILVTASQFESYACVMKRKQAYQDTLTEVGIESNHISIEEAESGALISLIGDLDTDCQDVIIFAVTDELANRVRTILQQESGAYRSISVISDRVPLGDICRQATQVLASALETGNNPPAGDHLFTKD